jgi:hypothetical protein
MNWVKYGSEAGTGDSSGGIGGSKPVGSGAATPATPKPAATPTPPATPPVNAQPTQPQWGPQLGGGGMFQQMLSNLGTPQGFGQAAGMMPGLFQGVGQLGGLPALMGIYQQMKSMRGGVGADDWSILTNPNYQKTAAAGDEVLTSASRSLAGQPGSWQNLASAPAAWRVMPKDTLGSLSQNAGRLSHAVRPGLDDVATGLVDQMPASAQEPAPEGHPYRTIAMNLGMDVARREGMHQGLNRSAGIWGPMLGAQAAKRLPGFKGSLLLDTPVNAMEDLGDLAGVLPH